MSETECPLLDRIEQLEMLIAASDEGSEDELWYLEEHMATLDEAARLMDAGDPPVVSDESADTTN